MTTLVIAPHADDELLGCGGMLLRRRAEGKETAWILVTETQRAGGEPDPATREREIETVRVGLDIPAERFARLGHPTTALDTVPMADLVGTLATLMKRMQPTEVLIPHFGDVHSDHRIVAEAATAATKWFRLDTIIRVLAYETLSETGFGGGTGFRADAHNRGRSPQQGYTELDRPQR